MNRAGAHKHKQSNVRLLWPWRACAQRQPTKEGVEKASRWSQGLPPPEEQVSKAGGACTGPPKLMRTVPSAVSVPRHNALHSCFCLRAGIPQYAHCPCMQQAHTPVEGEATHHLHSPGHDENSKPSTVWACAQL